MLCSQLFDVFHPFRAGVAGVKIRLIDAIKDGLQILITLNFAGLLTFKRKKWGGLKEKIENRNRNSGKQKLRKIDLRL